MVGKKSNGVRITFLLFALAASAAALAISIPQSASTAGGNTPVCGTISSSTVWDLAGSPYIVTCDVEVAIGVTLTIQAGTVVKFDLGTSLIIDGELIAMEATFTSNDTIPNPYDWNHILFNPSSVDAVFDAQGNYVSGSTIQGSIIEFGGGGFPVDGALEIDTAAPYILNNLVRENGSSGIHAVGVSASQPVRVQQNQVMDNSSGGGIFITAGLALSNTVSNNVGSGIRATNSTVMGNDISGNSSGRGGGIYALGSTLTGNMVSGNSAGASGSGGIYASASTVMGNSVIGNSTTFQCGGIDAVANSTIADNLVLNNGASPGRGGGICLNGGTATGNTIRGNASAYWGGGIYAVNAVIENNLIEQNSAVDGGGVYGDGSMIMNNTVSDNSASNNGGGIYIAQDGTAVGNWIENNLATQGGGIYTQQVGPQAVNLTANTVQSNTANLGAGIYAVESVVVGNGVSSNTASTEGGGIFAEGGTLDGNTVSFNSAPAFGHGSGVYLSGSVEFTNNRVMTNTASGGTAGGLSIDGQPALLRFNNIFGNQPYDAEVISPDAVVATLNYWGAVPCASISGQIYDGDDLPGRGELSYAPSLYAPVVLAQFDAPGNLSISQHEESSVTLSWSANPPIPNIGCRHPQAGTPDIGYLLYYDTDSACAFDGVGLPGGDSPIDLGQDTTVMLTGLASGQDYYFTVTAYDYLDRESPFATPISIQTAGNRLYLPLIRRAGGG